MNKIKQILKQNKFFAGILLVLFVSALISIFTTKTKQALANPLEFPPSVKSSVATSTGIYMAKYATSTSAVFDSYAILQASSTSATTVGFNPTASLGLTALVHLTATTGVPTLNIACEASQNRIDWFKRDCYNTATTSNVFNLAEPSTYTWIYASSTCAVGGLTSLSNQSTCTRAFSLTTPTRYTRLVFSVASTTAVVQAAGVGNVDLSYELVPLKERN